MKKSGFTLIELSIVLIIIGLIIGGVMKGRDLITSAEQKKIYNTWFKQWQVLSNSYQDRTGSFLDDGPNNGGTGTENGVVDGENPLPAGVITAIEGVGLDLPETNIVNKPEQYRIKGKYVTQTSRIWFWSGSGHGNAIFFDNMPTDYAIAFDKMTDGKADGKLGDFRRYNGGPDKAWPNAKTTTTVRCYYILH